jgi:hypothetical protein
MVTALSGCGDDAAATSAADSGDAAATSDAGTGDTACEPATGAVNSECSPVDETTFVQSTPSRLAGVPTTRFSDAPHAIWGAFEVEVRMEPLRVVRAPGPQPEPLRAHVELHRLDGELVLFDIEGRVKLFDGPHPQPGDEIRLTTDLFPEWDLPVQGSDGRDYLFSLYAGPAASTFEDPIEWEDARGQTIEATVGVQVQCTVAFGGPPCGPTDGTGGELAEETAALGGNSWPIPFPGWDRRKFRLDYPGGWLEVIDQVGPYDPNWFAPPPQIVLEAYGEHDGVAWTTRTHADRAYWDYQGGYHLIPVFSFRPTPALGAIRFIEFAGGAQGGGGSLTFHDENFTRISSTGGPLQREVLPPP